MRFLRHAAACVAARFGDSHPDRAGEEIWAGNLLFVHREMCPVSGVFIRSNGAPENAPWRRPTKARTQSRNIERP